MSQTPLAFLSYVNLDDQHDQGRLTQFRERLSGEVRMQTGEPFDIFQDRKDIAWGQQWQERLDSSLAAVTFLLPIITPAFFKSDACREELERFLKREKELGRRDLILPVYYVNCPVLKDKEKLKHNPLAQIIAARQYVDWRELRFEEFTSPQVRKSLAEMAKQIAAALERSHLESSRAAAARPASKQPEKESKGADSQSNMFQSGGGPQSAALGEGAIGTQINYGVPVETFTQLLREAQLLKAQLKENKPQSAPTAKVEPPTVVVDAFHRGDYVTITEALKAVKAGTRILVRPGVYKEGIVIDKPVEIIGDGNREEIVIEAYGKDVILFQANNGRIANLTICQLGGIGAYCVNIVQNRLELEDCDISSQSRACVVIHDSADPILRRCCIHNGKEGGVVICKNGLGTIEDNDIFANARAGIEISTGGNPTVRRCRIYNGNQDGVFVYENSQGLLEDNEIFANALSGVSIKTGSNPTLRRCRISKNGYVGIQVYLGGAGIFEGNDLRGNAKGAWEIKPGCEALVQRKGNIE